MPLVSCDGVNCNDCSINSIVRKLGRNCIQMILESEDLPYGVKCDLSEGEEMFWLTVSML